jgi:phage protein U
MVLPPELAGKSSITYVNDEDRDKPKSQQYAGYCEERLVLP